MSVKVGSGIVVSTFISILLKIKHWLNYISKLLLYMIFSVFDSLRIISSMVLRL